MTRAEQAGPLADAVVVAAGASLRMEGTNKLTALLGGRPLIAWTLDAIAGCASVEGIVLVAPHERTGDWRSAGWLPSKVVDVVPGGPRRQESVAAGVKAIDRLGRDDRRVVLVHDGARPAIRRALIERIVDATLEHGAAVPVLPIDETIERVDSSDRITGTVDRTGLVTAQTPQGIQLGLLREAFLRFPPEAAETFTDEASLLAACTIPVHAVRGQSDNIKVTVADDLRRVAAMIGAMRPRIGLGRDAHAFGPGSPLALGGVAFETAPRLRGHSDGDVVLHAVANALLGAAAMGDLGQVHPADERTPRGVDSGRLLTHVIATIAGLGLVPGYVDVTIVAARPSLGPRLNDIRGRLAELLGVGLERVNVKASTGNLLGMEGEGRGVSAEAIVTLVDA